MKSFQITNYELGVIFPLRDEAHVDRVVCWKCPVMKYTGGEVPWVSSSFFEFFFCDVS